MTNQGLLRRATEFRFDPSERPGTDSVGRRGLVASAAPGSPDGAGGGAADDGRDGISAQDRAEIVARIDEISKDNRIGLDADSFVVKPAKKGFLLPLAVNLAAIAVTAAALFGLKTFFSDKEARYSDSGATLASAEGKLLQELKRDAEGRLSEKDQEIAAIQQRLASVEREQAQLRLSFDERLAARERDFQEQLQREVAAERERLLAQGLAEEAIRERLKTFEAEKLASYQAQIDEFRKSLEAERSAAEANYAKLREEYQGNISSLNEERKRIQAEAQKKQDELRASLEAKTAALETERTRLAGEAALSQQGLAQAKAELSRIEEQRAAAVASEDRVVGLFLSARGAFQDRRYEDAARAAASLRSYLSDPAQAALPSGRREADLYAADALERIARTELQRDSVDTSVLLRQAELVTSIKASVAEASRLRLSGQAAGAAEAYSTALEQIPEVLEAHSYFMDRSEAEVARSLARFKTALGEAENAAGGGNYGAAAAAYGEAATLMGLGAADAGRLVDGISSLGAVRSDAAARSAETANSEAALARADRELADSRWPEALSAYVGVLASYPRSSRSGDALKGIRAALSGMSADAAARLGAAGRRSDELQAEIDRLSSELEDDARRLATAEDAAATGAAARSAAETQAAESARRIAELEKLLEAARSESAAASAAAVPSAEGVAAADAGLAADLERLRSDNLRLAAAAEAYDAMLADFRRYSAAEDASLAKGGSASLVEARSQLDSFLSSPELRSAFPDLRDRIARYEGQFVAAGQRESVLNAAMIVETALALKDPASRDRYLDETSQRYAEDQDMQEFLQTLRRGLR